MSDVLKRINKGAAVGDLELEIERLQSRIELLTAENKQLHADYWTQNSCIADLHDERRTLLAEVERLTIVLEDAEQRVKDVQFVCDHNKAQIKRQFAELKQANADNSRLRAALEWIGNNRLHPRCPTCATVADTARASLGE